MDCFFQEGQDDVYNGNKLLRAFFEGHADGAILGKSNLSGAGEILRLSDWNSWRRERGASKKNNQAIALGL